LARPKRGASPERTKPCIMRWLEPATATLSRASRASWSIQRWSTLGSSGEARTRWGSSSKSRGPASRRVGPRGPGGKGATANRGNRPRQIRAGLRRGPRRSNAAASRRRTGPPRCRGRRASCPLEQEARLAYSPPAVDHDQPALFRGGDAVQPRELVLAVEELHYAKKHNAASHNDQAIWSVTGPGPGRWWDPGPDRRGYVPRISRGWSCRYPGR
jgi:hypothetical protein